MTPRRSKAAWEALRVAWMLSQVSIRDPATGSFVVVRRRDAVRAGLLREPTQEDLLEHETRIARRRQARVDGTRPKRMKVTVPPELDRRMRKFDGRVLWGKTLRLRFEAALVELERDRARRERRRRARERDAQRRKRAGKPPRLAWVERAFRASPRRRTSL